MKEEGRWQGEVGTIVFSSLQMSATVSVSNTRI